MKPAPRSSRLLFLIPAAARAAEDLGGSSADRGRRRSGQATGAVAQTGILPAGGSPQRSVREDDQERVRVPRVAGGTARVLPAADRRLAGADAAEPPDRRPPAKGKATAWKRLLLESRPGFHVTANLYLPDSPPPWPAVLIPCGHSHDGKAAGQYQRASILLAKHGMAAICYDPIGQGERYQIIDPAGRNSKFEDAPHVATPHPSVRLLCTTEHTMIGLGCALLGANVAQYRIWDGMRVIDYLQSRPDILADKIGCAGNSGGGTETAYLMALDDRIVAAAPAAI